MEDSCPEPVSRTAGAATNELAGSGGDKIIRSPFRVKGRLSSALPACLSVKGGILLYNLGSSALRAFDLAPVMLGHSHLNRKILPAALASIFIDRHRHSPFLEFFLLNSKLRIAAGKGRE